MKDLDRRNNMTRLKLSKKRIAVCLTGLILLAVETLASAATLEVGPGKAFARIEEANAKAKDGDVILVYPLANHRQYEKTAVFVRQKNLTFRGMPAERGGHVIVNGRGFDYSGAGSTPRAIFQFNAGADNCTLEGFELVGAHNSSHNGAGVRINQANHVTVRNCSIHANDMGIMSNGDGTLARGVDQRIERCSIFRNGDPGEPGQNHNLYLGGTSATLRFCEVHHSLTGHNVKSRAHSTRVEYCYIHHSANREFDLVEAAETTRPESDAVVLGCIIVKDPRCPGNHGVIHFGQDGGKAHNGTLYLAFDTIVTPFVSPLVDLSTSGAKADFVGDIVSSGGAKQAGLTVAAVRGGAELHNVAGRANWFYGDFANGRGGLAAESNHYLRQPGELFVGVIDNNYRLMPVAARSMKIDASAELLELPKVPGMAEADVLPPLAWQYQHPASGEKRGRQEQAVAGAVGH
jgi:hypothetical protein